MAHDPKDGNEIPGTHLVYLERGKLCVASLVSVSARKCRIDDQDGVRRRLSRDKVVSFADAKGAQGLADRATEIADALDVEMAWQAAAGEAVSVADLAAKVLPEAGEQERQAALRLAHARQGTYFTESKEGLLRPITATQRDRIKEAADRRRKRKEQEGAWTADLDEGRVPDKLRLCLERHLKSGGDVGDPDFRFLLGYCKGKEKSIGLLALEFGIFKDMEELHLSESLMDYPPARNVMVGNAKAPGRLSTVATGALSIDSRGTTEIDDAFAVGRGPGGTWDVAVCISAPALGLDGEAELQSMERMVTLYLPGHKREMLPVRSIEQYSLLAPFSRPTVALVSRLGDGGELSKTDFAVGEVDMSANLQIEEFGPDDLMHDGLGKQDTDSLRVLGDFAASIKVMEPRPRNNRGYIVRMDDGVASVVPRSNFAAADDLVASLMIHYNSKAAEFLLEKRVPFIGRRDGRQLVYDRNKDVEGAYGWFSSPLRRIIDLLNQRQLLAAIRGEEAPYGAPEMRELACQFDRSYERARTLQRNFEKFWCLRMLEEFVGHELPATASSVPGRLILEGYPLMVYVKGNALRAGKRASVRLDKVDTYLLVAEGTVA